MFLSSQLAGVLSKSLEIGDDDEDDDEDVKYCLTVRKGPSALSTYLRENPDHFDGQVRPARVALCT